MSPYNAILLPKRKKKPADILEYKTVVTKVSKKIRWEITGDECLVLFLRNCEGSICALGLPSFHHTFPVSMRLVSNLKKMSLLDGSSGMGARFGSGRDDEPRRA